MVSHLSSLCFLPWLRSQSLSFSLSMLCLPSLSEEMIFRVVWIHIILKTTISKLQNINCIHLLGYKILLPYNCQSVGRFPSVFQNCFILNNRTWRKELYKKKNQNYIYKNGIHMFLGLLTSRCWAASAVNPTVTAASPINPPYHPKYK